MPESGPRHYVSKWLNTSSKMPWDIPHAKRSSWFQNSLPTHPPLVHSFAKYLLTAITLYLPYSKSWGCRNKLDIFPALEEVTGEKLSGHLCFLTVQLVFNPLALLLGSFCSSTAGQRVSIPSLAPRASSCDTGSTQSDIAMWNFNSELSDRRHRCPESLVWVSSFERHQGLYSVRLYLFLIA